MQQLNLFDLDCNPYVLERVEEETISPKIQKITPKREIDKIVAGLFKKRDSAWKKAKSISTEILGNPTYKRSQEAEHRRNEKDKQMTRVRILTRIIEEWKMDNVPLYFQKIRNMKDIEFLQGYYPKHWDDSYPEWRKDEMYKRFSKSTKMGITSEAQWEVMSNDITLYGQEHVTEEQARVRAMESTLREIQMMNIPGFFPTPDNLIDICLEEANCEKGMSYFEPSAGTGSFLDKIKDFDSTAKIVCCEINPTLNRFLELKGYLVIAHDMYDAIPVEGFDRIIMNPPFEKQQDIDHVTYCFDKFLQKGGRLVSVMSAGVMSNGNKKATAFRTLVSKYGWFRKLAGGEFKNSFNPTAVSTCIVILDKP